MEILDKGMIHIPGRMEQYGVKFYYTTQNDAQFKTHELFTFGILHLVFLGHG